MIFRLIQRYSLAKIRLLMKNLRRIRNPGWMFKARIIVKLTALAGRIAAREICNPHSECGFPCAAIAPKMLNALYQA
jgi:hypothetical protein